MIESGHPLLLDYDTEKAVKIFLAHPDDEGHQSSATKANIRSVAIVLLLISGISRLNTERYRPYVESALKEADDLLLNYQPMKANEKVLFETALLLRIKIRKMLQMTDNSRIVFETLALHVNRIEHLMEYELEGQLVSDFADIVLNYSENEICDALALALSVLTAFLLRNSESVNEICLSDNFLWQCRVELPSKNVLLSKSELLDQLLIYRFSSQLLAVVDSKDGQKVPFFNARLTIQQRIAAKKSEFQRIADKLIRLLNSQGITSDRRVSTLNDLLFYLNLVSSKKEILSKKSDEPTDYAAQRKLFDLGQSELSKSSLFRFIKSGKIVPVDSKKNGLAFLTSKALAFVGNIFTAKEPRVPSNQSSETLSKNLSELKMRKRINVTLLITEKFFNKSQASANENSFAFSSLLAITSQCLHLNFPSVRIQIGKLGARLFSLAENSSERVNSVLEMLMHSMSNLNSIESIALILAMAIEHLSESWLSNLRIIITNVFMKVLRMDLDLGKQAYGLASVIALQENSPIYKSIFESLLVIVHSDLLFKSANNPVYLKLMNESLNHIEGHSAVSTSLHFLLKDQLESASSLKTDMLDANRLVINREAIISKVSTFFENKNRFTGLWELQSFLNSLEVSITNGPCLRLKIESKKSLGTYFRILGVARLVGVLDKLTEVLVAQLKELGQEIVEKGKVNFEDLVGLAKEFLTNDARSAESSKELILARCDKLASFDLVDLCTEVFKNSKTRNLMRDEIISLSQKVFELIVATFSRIESNQKNPVYELLQIFLTKFENFDEKGTFCECPVEFNLSLFYCIQIEALIRNELKSRRVIVANFKPLLDNLALIFRISHKSDLVLLKASNKFLMENYMPSSLRKTKCKWTVSAITSTLERLEIDSPSEYFQLFCIVSYAIDVSYYLRITNDGQEALNLIANLFDDAIKTEFLFEFLKMLISRYWDLNSFLNLSECFGEKFTTSIIIKGFLSLSGPKTENEFADLLSVDSIMRLIYPFEFKTLENQAIQWTPKELQIDLELAWIRLQFLEKVFASNNSIKFTHSELIYVIEIVTYCLELIDRASNSLNDGSLLSENSYSFSNGAKEGRQDLEAISILSAKLYRKILAKLDSLALPFKQISRFLELNIVQKSKEVSRITLEILKIFFTSNQAKTAASAKFFTRLISHFIGSLSHLSSLNADFKQEFFSSFVNTFLGPHNKNYSQIEMCPDDKDLIMKNIQREISMVIDGNNHEISAALITLAILLIDFLQIDPVKARLLLTKVIWKIGEEVSSSIYAIYKEHFKLCECQSFNLLMLPLLYSFNNKNEPESLKRIRLLIAIVMDRQLRSHNSEAAVALLRLLLARERKEDVKAILAKLSDLGSLNLAESANIEDSEILEEIRKVKESSKALARFNQPNVDEVRGNKPSIPKLGAIKTLKRIEK